MAIARSTGTFVPLPPKNTTNCRDEKYVWGNKILYTYDYTFHKTDPKDHIKWCRKNMGERGSGWDFHTNQGTIVVEVWDDKLKFMYELWKN